MKRLIGLLLSVFIALALLPVTAFAGASASASDVSCYVGENVSVKITVSAGEAIGSMDAIATFDSSILEYVSYSDSMGGMDSCKGNVIVISDYDAKSTSSKVTVTITFKALAVGSAQISYRADEVVNVDDDDLGGVEADATVSVKAKPAENLSSNCNLSSLTVPKGCTLSPSFSKSVTSYTCKVDYSVDKFPMDWKTEDSSAKTTVSGAVTLSVGENTRSVKVTAADGTTKTYTVKIIRGQTEDEAEETPTHTAVTPPPDKTVKVTVDETEYTVKNIITLLPPEGFSIAYVMYEDYEFQMLILNDIYLAQLAEGNISHFFRFDAETATFHKYYAISSSCEYTVLTGELEGYSATTAAINGVSYPALTNGSMEDGYCVLYVLNNLTGEKYFASYCAYDETIQRLASNPASASVSAITSGKSAVESNQTDKQNIIIGCGIVGALLLCVLIGVIAANPRKRARVAASRQWGFDETALPAGCDDNGLELPDETMENESRAVYKKIGRAYENVVSDNSDSENDDFGDFS